MLRLAAFCLVTASVPVSAGAAINFEVRLPTRDWNGKFYMAGCGGFCGRLDSDLPGLTNAMNHGLRRGYAAATMDSGHWGAHRADGLIDDPRNCDWQPSSLACRSDPAATCLTQEEVTVLGKWYAGPRDASARQLYPGGVPRGSEPYWPLWLTGKPGDRMPDLVPLFAQDFLRLFMPPGFDHCGMQAGPGANDAGFDPLPALEAWVERSVAPDSVPSARIHADGAVPWSRLVCPYSESAGCGS